MTLPYTPTRHTLYAVGIGSSVLGGISKQSIVPGSEVKAEQTDGDIYAAIVALYHQKVVPSFTTYNIAAALNLCGTTGVDIASLTGGLNLYAQKHADGAGIGVGSVHRQYGFNSGILFPKTLSVDNRGDATIVYDAVITSDGTNAPIVISEAVALPAGVDAERFALGPCTVGGVALAQTKHLQIDFGIDVLAEGHDELGLIWDVFSSIRAIQTAITIKGTRVDWFGDTGAIPLGGLPAGHTDTTLWLRKRLAGSAFVDDATAEHISFTASGLAVVDHAMDASKNDAAECAIKITTNFDGTNLPLVVNTAAAIATASPGP